MNDLPKVFLDKLEKRKLLGHLRQCPRTNDFPIDFYSNDYLGFAKDKELTMKSHQTLLHQTYKNGSGSARLIAGNHLLHQRLEKTLRVFHNASDALLYNSGYDANIGLFEALGHRHSTVLYDEFIHASIRDGIRMGDASSQQFRHNDLG